LIYLITIFKIFNILLLKKNKKDNFKHVMELYSKISDYCTYFELVLIVIKMINEILNEISYIIITNIKNNKKIKLENIVKRIAFINVLGISQIVIIIALKITLEISNVKIDKNKKLKIRIIQYNKNILRTIINFLFLRIYIKITNTD